MDMPRSATPTTRPRIVAGLRLLRRVGSGGEGEVWEARDADGRRRALKLVRPDALAPDAEQRSHHLLAIDHPALVRVYRGGRLHDGPLAGWGFLEMAFVDGPSLHDAPPDPAVLDRLWPLAEALDLLHTGHWTAGLPLVHRDVKPANLVSSLDGSVVLVDPSTLRGVDATQLTRIGTPVFSAPEVMTGRFGPPADVYSFAATVVALLTGARGEQLAAVLDEAHLLELPDGVAHALSPAPGDRPASCRAVLEAGTELADDPTLLLSSVDAARDWDEHVDTGGAWPAAAPVPAQGSTAAAPHRRRRLWPWAWLFCLLLGVPAAAVWTGTVSPADMTTVGLAVVGVHLFAHAVGRTPAALAVLCPPVAWGVLLGSRLDGGRRRRAWGSAVFTAATLPAVVGGVVAVADGLPAATDAVLAGIAATVLLVGLCASAADVRGGGAALARLLLTPLWVLGAALLVVGGVLLAPFGIARGTVWTTATSLVDGIRAPAMMPPVQSPRWR